MFLHASMVFCIQKQESRMHVSLWVEIMYTIDQTQRWHHCICRIGWTWQPRKFRSYFYNNNRKVTMVIQWNLCNPTPEFSDILWHTTKMYSPKVFLLTKIKHELSDILHNLTHFPGTLLCRIRQVPLYNVNIVQISVKFQKLESWVVSTSVTILYLI